MPWEKYIPDVFDSSWARRTSTAYVTCALSTLVVGPGRVHVLQLTIRALSPGMGSGPRVGRGFPSNRPLYQLNGN